MRNPRAARFLRYAAGSVLASLVSAATLAVAYRGLRIGPALSSVVAFCAGLLINFVVYRFWAWRKRATPGVGRDFAKYSVVAICTALVALGTTSVADAYARRAGLDPTQRTLVVEGSYFGAFAVMFIAKFLVLDRFVFNARVDDSRTQVENTTRA